MSNETQSTPPKRPLVSIPFLIVVCALGVAAYLAGPTVMTYVMYYQESLMGSAGRPSDPMADEEFLDEGGEGTEDDEATEGDNAGGESGEGGRGPGRGAFDPESMFTQRDADGNGKLEGEEISERMQQGLAETDTDQDGAVSKEEFMARMAQFAGRRGQGGGGPGGERNRPAADSDSSNSNAVPSSVEPSTTPADTATPK